MPWKVMQGQGCQGVTPWAVIKTATGEKVSCHATEDDANAQVRLLYAKEREGSRMTTDAAPDASQGVPDNPLDSVPAWLRPLLPDWVGGLRDRAFALDDIEILSRAKGGDGRTVTAYAAVWDTPAEVRDQDGHYMEQIHRAAFDRSIRERAGRINVFYNHGKDLYGRPSDRFALPIGTPKDIRADARGLRTVTQYNRTALADEVLEAIKSGSMRGMSFTGGFLRSDPPGPYYARSSGELTLVTRQEIALIEYGPTPIPNYDDAEVVGVRAGQLDTAAAGGESGEQVREQVREQVTVAAAVTTGAESTESTEQQDAPAAHSTGAAEQDPPEQEPPTHSEVTGSNQKTSTRSRAVEPDVQQTLTAAERAVRQGEIHSRLAEIDTQFNGAALPTEVQDEWDALSREDDEHERAILADTARKQRLRELADRQAAANGGPGGGERVDNRTAGYGGYAQRTAPGQIRRPEDIYDLAAIRNRARSIDELPDLYRDHAMRAVEAHRFPGATGRNGNPSREQAQERVAQLLDTIDDEQGALAHRILVTGSPLYERAFGKMLAKMSTNGLTAEESRALSLGTDAAGGYAVPFQLDPTVILSSNGVVNPLRAISRVETIVGKEWDGVTSAGVTVSRGTEAQEVGTGDPAFAQPTVRTSRVQGWVPFSIELDVSWNALRTQLTRILQDAKDVEEATAFTTGNGTAPNPNGVVSTLGTASWVDTAGSAVLAAADIYLLENAMAPRFIANSRIVASKTTFNRFRTLFQAQASAAGDPFARPSGGMGPTFNDYPKHELSTMSTSIGTGSLIMLQGDFQQFLIVDRVGMGIELVPHVLGSNRRPTGERGVFALWFNNSKILVDNAFRLLRIKST